MNPKINVLLGTKAEMIKVAPVIKELENRGVPFRLIETGQHGAYLNELREEFQIREPEVRLGKEKDVDNLFEAFKWFGGLIWILANRKRVREQIFSTTSAICLIHGEKDEVVPSRMMITSKSIFKENNFSIETHLIDNLGHSIDNKGLDIGQKFLIKNLK